MNYFMNNEDMKNGNEALSVEEIQEGLNHAEESFELTQKYQKQINKKKEESEKMGDHYEDMVVNNSEATEDEKNEAKEVNTDAKIKIQEARNAAKKLFLDFSKVERALRAGAVDDYKNDEKYKEVHERWKNSQAVLKELNIESAALRKKFNILNNKRNELLLDNRNSSEKIKEFQENEKQLSKVRLELERIGEESSVLKLENQELNGENEKKDRSDKKEKGVNRDNIVDENREGETLESKRATKEVSENENLKQKLKEVLSNKESRNQILKTIGKTSLSSAASIAGVKGFYDVPAYFKQKLGVVKDKKEYKEIFSDLVLEEKREELDSKAEDGALVRISEYIDLDKISEMEGKIEAMDATEDTKNELMEELNALVENYNQEMESIQSGENDKITSTLDKYVKTKISGVQATREGLNTLFVASGAYALRGVSYGALALHERHQKLKQEAGAGGEVNFIKDTILKGAQETFQELAFRGEGTKLQKSLKAIKSFGSLARFTGITKTMFSAPENYDQAIEKLLDTLDGDSDWSKVGRNFVQNIERMIPFVGDAKGAEINDSENVVDVTEGMTERQIEQFKTFKNWAKEMNAESVFSDRELASMEIYGGRVDKAHELFESKAQLRLLKKFSQNYAEEGEISNWVDKDGFVHVKCENEGVVYETITDGNENLVSEELTGKVRGARWDHKSKGWVGGDISKEELATKRIERLQYEKDNGVIRVKGEYISGDDPGLDAVLGEDEKAIDLTKIKLNPDQQEMYDKLMEDASKNNLSVTEDDILQTVLNDDKENLVDLTDQKTEINLDSEQINIDKIEVKSGDTLWGIVGGMKEIEGLSDEAKKNVIANIIAVIEKNPEEYGFDAGQNIEELNIGQELNIGKFKDVLENEKINGEGLVEHAKNITVNNNDEVFEQAEEISPESQPKGGEDIKKDILVEDELSQEGNKLVEGSVLNKGGAYEMTITKMNSGESFEMTDKQGTVFRVKSFGNGVYKYDSGGTELLDGAVRIENGKLEPLHNYAESDKQILRFKKFLTPDVQQRIKEVNIEDRDYDFYHSLNEAINKIDRLKTEEIGNGLVKISFIDDNGYENESLLKLGKDVQIVESVDAPGSKIIKILSDGKEYSTDISSRRGSLTIDHSIIGDEHVSLEEGFGVTADNGWNVADSSEKVLIEGISGVNPAEFPKGVDVKFNREVVDLMDERGIRFERGKMVIDSTKKALKFTDDAKSVELKKIGKKIEVVTTDAKDKILGIVRIDKNNNAKLVERNVKAEQHPLDIAF